MEQLSFKQNLYQIKHFIFFSFKKEWQLFYYFIRINVYYIA
jgi:hypothetical protein